MEFNEGVDLNSRSDIAWLQNGEIEKNRIFIYFESKDKTSGGRKISKTIVDKIEKLGMKIICLKPNIMEISNYPFWYPNSEKSLHYPNIVVNDSIDKWLDLKGKIFISGF